jgi:hypothetical protein
VYEVQIDLLEDLGLSGDVESLLNGVPGSGPQGVAGRLIVEQLAQCSRQPTRVALGNNRPD